MPDISQKHNKEEKFSSSIGFLFAAIAAAVGLSNIWRFASEAAKYGGGFFVFAYLLCIVGVGYPIVLAEISFGRSKQKGLYHLYATEGRWKSLAPLAALTCFFIFCFYNVVAGWVLGYFWHFIYGYFARPEEGLFDLEKKQEFVDFFDNLRSNYVGNLIFTLIMAVAAAWIIQAGVTGGIERCGKILMPLFMAMMIGLIVYACTLNNISRGLAFYLKPRWEKFTMEGLASALSQSIMSLAIGMGALVTYGAYVNKKENLHKSALIISVGDTLVAFLAGFFLFAFMGHQNVDFDNDKHMGGTGLAFATLPHILINKLGMKTALIVGASFFLLLLFAAITSSITLLEVPTRYIESRYKTDRAKTVWITMLVSYGISILCILSDSNIASIPTLFHTSKEGLTNFHDLFQKLVIDVLATFSTFLFSLFIAFKWGVAALFNESSVHKAPNRLFARYVHVTIKYVCPLLTAFSCVYAMYNLGSLLVA